MHPRTRTPGVVNCSDSMQSAVGLFENNVHPMDPQGLSSHSLSKLPFWDLVDPIFRREESESYRIPAKIPPVAVSLEARIETPS